MLLARRACVALVVPLLAAGLTGCGSSSPPESGGSDAITVGVVPVIDVAPLYLGISKGYFSQQRLALTVKQSQGGSTIVASVVAGQTQIGFSNNTSLLIGASKGLPVRIVAAGNQAAAGDYAAILVRDDSPIRTVQDLAGKQIAVNNLNNVGSLTVNAALEASGVDIATVKYVEIPFPEMGATLSQRRVDAVWAVEPFVSLIKSAGGVRVATNTYPLVAPHFPVASYFVSTSYAKSTADVVDRFRRAMNTSLQYAQAHPDEVRRILPTYIKLTQQVADQVVLPEWNTDVGAALLGRTADLALRYGYLKSKPDVQQLVNG
jgi:NitT/TauT family transport system substrate-binding protein